MTRGKEFIQNKYKPKHGMTDDIKNIYIYCPDV
jgi:hypothetical protein